MRHAPLTGLVMLALAATDAGAAGPCKDLGQTFTATGTVQTAVFPARVYRVEVTAAGAQGGGDGGLGAVLSGTFDVVPGDSWQIVVGTAGGVGYGNGGGGGSFVLAGT